MENFFEFLKENTTVIDIIFIIFVLYNLISGIKNGLIGSLLSFSKWIVAFFSSKVFFLPIFRPYVDGILSSEFVTDLINWLFYIFITFIFSFVNQ